VMTPLQRLLSRTEAAAAALRRERGRPDRVGSLLGVRQRAASSLLSLSLVTHLEVGQAQGLVLEDGQLLLELDALRKEDGEWRER
jgi:hypothetical protein